MPIVFCRCRTFINPPSPPSPPSREQTSYYRDQYSSPKPVDASAGQAKHALGGQGQLWGELIPDQRRREFMAYPRACALSEVLWSPKEGRNLNQFLPGLVEHLKRLEASQVNYRPLDRALSEELEGS